MSPAPSGDRPATRAMGRGGMACQPTRRGWRLSQHGTVLSEVLRSPGPTHSVFDVLAAACLMDSRPRDIALLGFGGGGVVAALRALGSEARLHAVDLDPTGRRLLQRAGAEWLSPLIWQQGDAVDWLRQAGKFDVIVEDLSVARAGEVEKPAVTWTVLPPLIAQHLRSGGRAILNLLHPGGAAWSTGLAQVARPFASALVLSLRDFENRIVVAGQQEIAARRAGRQLRALLTTLQSRQASRLHISRFP